MSRGVPFSLTLSIPIFIFAELNELLYESTADALTSFIFAVDKFSIDGLINPP